MQEEQIREETRQTAERPRRGRRRLRRRRAIWAAVCLLTLLAASCAFLLWYGREAYNLARHGVVTLKSGADRDGDLIDDYADIVLGARRYVKTGPVYDDGYFAGGYPPEGRGVCADVIWRALEAAGYDFKAMVDEDIAKNPSAYPLQDGLPDANIDFRRVVNLQVWFERNGESLTLDAEEIGAWQPGDFVFYEGHTAIVSDRRNSAGQPWIIHHTGHGAFEEDALTYRPIIGHYRWKADQDG